MAKTLIGSVGIGGRNLHVDVLVVQRLLNRVPLRENGPDRRLRENGKCDAETKIAIIDFQTYHFGAAAADGRIDPGKQTLTKLNAYDKPDPAANIAADANEDAFDALHYSQGDHRWKSDRLTGGATIQQCGCAMTSIAMALAGRGYRINGIKVIPSKNTCSIESQADPISGQTMAREAPNSSSIDDQPNFSSPEIVTPKNLNAWLKAHAGYDGNNIRWQTLNQLTAHVRFQDRYKHQHDLSADDLRARLDAGNKAIVANVHQGGHWVLLTGHNGDTTFYCEDPGDSTTHSYCYRDFAGYAVYTMD
jgi:hypothetical protein